MAASMAVCSPRSATKVSHGFVGVPWRFPSANQEVFDTLLGRRRLGAACPLPHRQHGPARREINMQNEWDRGSVGW
jgi:hypothetical protein